MDEISTLRLSFLKNEIMRVTISFPQLLVFFATVVD